MTIDRLIAALRVNVENYTATINDPDTDADHRRRLTLVRDAYQRDIKMLSAQLIGA